MADEPEAPISIDLTALGVRLREQTEGSEERQAFLDKLRRQIQAGEYHPDSEALARKLIEEAGRNHCADDDAK